MLSKLRGENSHQPKPPGQVSRLTLANLRRKLGEGPMRFAPQEPRERGTKDQVESLEPVERDCFDYLKSKWESRYPTISLTEDHCLRFARCSSFNARDAWKVMKKCSKQNHQLLAEALETQLRTKTCFPVPKLRTKDGFEVCYMRPSRYAAKVTACGPIVDNVNYALSTMMEREVPCTKGVTFMANMNDFKMSNFNTDYWFQLMSLIQGQTIAVRVNLFLIVNPPEWFETAIYKITKGMLTADFQKRVKMISELELVNFLSEGFEVLLPDELSAGRASTEEMVKDFVEYRKAVEAAQGHGNAPSVLPPSSRANSLRRFDLTRQTSSMSVTSDRSGGMTATGSSRRGMVIPRQVSCRSLTSNKSERNISIAAHSNHSSKRNSLLSSSSRELSCQSLSIASDSPRKQRVVPPPRSPSMKGRGLFLTRQFSSQSLTAESSASESPRRQSLPKQLSSSMSKLRSSPPGKSLVPVPAWRSSSHSLIGTGGMPMMDMSFTSISSDITEEESFVTGGAEVLPIAR